MCTPKISLFLRTQKNTTDTNLTTFTKEENKVKKYQFHKLKILKLHHWSVPTKSLTQISHSVHHSCFAVFFLNSELIIYPATCDNERFATLCILYVYNCLFIRVGCYSSRCYTGQTDAMIPLTMNIKLCSCINRCIYYVQQSPGPDLWDNRLYRARIIYHLQHTTLWQMMTLDCPANISLANHSLTQIWPTSQPMWTVLQLFHLQITP